MQQKQKKKDAIAKRKVHEGEIEIPEQVSVKMEPPGYLIVQGPLGTVKKDFSKVPVEFAVEDQKISYKVFMKGRKGYALVNTIKAIITNLLIGVTKGFTYKMKIYYRHFPVTVEVADGEVMIKNFMGERGVRRARIVGTAKVKVIGDTVLVYGISKEDVGLTVANIMAACKVKNRDPRVFLDGIYPYAKEVGLPSE